MLPARHRLTDPADFAAVTRGRGSRRRGHPLLVVHLREAAEGEALRPARVGLTVSKAVGGSVTRHRVARQLRHQAAACLPLIPAGSDLVVRANPPAAEAGSAALGAALRDCLRRLLGEGDPR